jgi:maleamate amidohydrolase
MDLDKTTVGLGSRPALILVDMMLGFTDPACPLGSESEAVIAANKAMLGLFREKSLPIFFTKVVYDTPDQGAMFRAKVPALNLLQRGSPWTDINPMLAPKAGETVIEKHYASGFFGTELQDQLVASGADSLVVTGLTTSGCVRATAVDGLQHGWRVVIPEEAVGDRNASAHAANLHDFNAKYGDVMGLKDVLARLTQGLTT